MLVAFAKWNRNRTQAKSLEPNVMAVMDRKHEALAGCLNE
jgi:hypothetical protein